MKISIYVDNESVDLRIFDFLRSHLYQSHPDFSIDYHKDKNLLQASDFKILFSSMPSTLNENLNDFDLVLFSNADEPTTVATETIVNNLNLKNSYLIANAWTNDRHPLKNKILPFCNDMLVTRQYWTSAFFPQYHQHLKNQNTKTKNMIFVNGANRSWRHHAITEIKKLLPEISVHSVWSTVIHETNDAPWESTEDKIFRDHVNFLYPISRNVASTYYENSACIKVPSTAIGLPQGDCFISPGYFIPDFYYIHRCVIFPESSWQNNEVSPTEKAAKCFFTKTLPFPIGGSNINQIYNDLGFSTAWNLLPTELQEYDNEQDHLIRYRVLSKAVKWLHDHPKVFHSQEYRDIINKNYNNFFANDLDLRSVSRLLDLILDQ